MSRLRAAHQLLQGAVPEAARDNALELQLLLWASDVRSDVFADGLPEELAALVRDPREIASLPHDALLLVHHTAEEAPPERSLPPLTELAALPQRKVLVHHAGADPKDLEGLAASFVLGVGDTEVEREQLAGAGFTTTAVLRPLGRCDEGVAAAREQLRHALAIIGLDLPEPRARNVVVISSERRCGIHDYSVAVCEGLRRRGHRVTFIGVRPADTDDLFRKLPYIRGDVDTVIIEHEAGVFRDVTLARALFELKRRGFKVVVSFHELEPEKFHHYRRLLEVVRQPPVKDRSIAEALRVPWSALLMANWFVRYRLVLALIGGLPDRLVVHSRRSARWLPLLTSDADRHDQFPLAVMPLEGTDRPRDAAEKRALRKRLGLPLDAFIFVSPGFFFPRKRFVEVMRALPSDAFLVLAGTASEHKADYHAEVMAEAAKRRNVIVSQDYDAMGDHVVAADCVVLFYEDVFQSAVITQAVWAGLTCIVSDAEGFGPYWPAAIVARDTAELARAMAEVRRPETQARLQRGVETLRRVLAPERLADRYLAGLGR